MIVRLTNENSRSIFSPASKRMTEMKWLRIVTAHACILITLNKSDIAVTLLTVIYQIFFVLDHLRRHFSVCTFAFIKRLKSCSITDPLLCAMTFWPLLIKHKGKFYRLGLNVTASQRNGFRVPWSHFQTEMRLTNNRVILIDDAIPIFHSLR